ncbi:FAD-dependent monooxygenase [Microvirga flavescens]|uniref:FAD-dependent monooxygenase n=1 Tax=Microvirga flavescens TaxID=2249811 RepID=UPI000DD61546|nr:FAD-dependent monooxygenase [Microvirga flavescens]
MSGLSFAVVGAGIGGLTAALALARQGHAVMLIERRTGFSEVGAGLQLSPNASCILIDLGLGHALQRVVGEPERVVVRAIGSGKTIGEVAQGSFMRERFGAPYWVVHRADLQTLLLDAVRSQPGIRLVMGRKVETIETGPQGAELTLTTDNGLRETFRADAVIGADGVWSKVRQAAGMRALPSFRGSVAWRATLDHRQVPAALAGNETGLWLGSKGHVVHYPIANGRLLNIVAIERRKHPVEGWSAPGEAKALLSHYASATPLLKDLLGRVDNWLLWSLFDLPARVMAKDRIALLGDAAHPVLPFLAQGAALAIEDAATLAAVMPQSADEIPQAFSLYESRRLERARRVQAEARTNGRIYHAGPLVSFGRNRVMQRLGPQGMTERYSWLYDFKIA